VDYQKEGFDINKIKDKVYMYSNSKYVPLDEELYNDVMSGKRRL